MAFYTLKNTRGEIVFRGPFASVRHCAETAVRESVSLQGVKLRRANLRGANLDGALLEGADLRGANLEGANLSEARLDKSRLEGANLQGACLCESSLRWCDFRDASFGATQIAGSDLTGSIFSTLSAFTLDFASCQAMAGCIYHNAHGESCPISQPPVVISGLPRPVVLMDRHIKIGHAVATYAQWIHRFRDQPGPAASGFVFERREGEESLARLILALQRERRSRTSAALIPLPARCAPDGPGPNPRRGSH